MSPSPSEERQERERLLLKALKSRPNVPVTTAELAKELQMDRMFVSHGVTHLASKYSKLKKPKMGIYIWEDKTSPKPQTPDDGAELIAALKDIATAIRDLGSFWK